MANDDRGIMLPFVDVLHSLMRLRRLSRHILQKVEWQLCSSGATRLRVDEGIHPW